MALSTTDISIVVIEPNEQVSLVTDENGIIVETLDEEIHVTTIEEPVTLNVYEQGMAGPKGDTGATGSQGAPGSVGGDLAYTHNQIVPSATWVIDHPLAKFPSVGVIDSAGTVVEGDVFYESINRVIVNFDAPFGGKAYLN